MTNGDQGLADRLRRMQWLATGLVLVMAVLFVVTSVLRADYPVLDYVWAFAEAALIGGLADWFAVTALFRRPLGLPIPHTAIVPTRKNEIGRALARFVAEHFLVRDVVVERLRGTDLAARFGAWLERPGNAAQLTRDIAIGATWLLRSVDSENLRQAVKLSLRELAQNVPVHKVLATLVDVLIAGNHAQALVDTLVEFGRDQLESNKDRIRERIHERSPWWLPKFVDREIYDQLVGEFERILGEVGTDPSHPARDRLTDGLRNLKSALVSDADLMQRSEAVRDEILDHPQVKAFAREVWVTAKGHLEQSLSDPDSALRRGLEAQTLAVGKTLAEDAAVRERLNGWLVEALVYAIENYREPISEVISATVEQWDAASTSRRIELQIGRDLQFIRINGTLVGGLVGVALYSGWALLVA
jgi:uncharacterized membrane-anchored protein YjiN (DUF445 family)